MNQHFLAPPYLDQLYRFYTDCSYTSSFTSVVASSMGSTPASSISTEMCSIAACTRQSIS